MNETILHNTVDSYSAYLQLPIWMVNTSGTLVYSARSNDNEKCLEDLVLKEALSIGKAITKPAVFTSYEAAAVNQRFILSPVIKWPAGSFFLLAGPFREEEEKRPAGKSSSLCSGSNETVEAGMKKINALLSLLSVLRTEQEKKECETKLKQLFEGLRKENGECTSYEEYIKEVVQHMLATKKVDFLGHATRNEEEVFTIDCAEGASQASSLVNRSFFIGEGLLGQSVAVGKEMHWENLGDTNRARYFHKHDFHPAALFAFPVKKNGVVEEVFFGGTVEELKLDEAFLEVVYVLLSFVGRKKTWYATKQILESKQLLVNTAMDWANVLLQSADLKSILYKLLDVCEMFSAESSACFTSVQGEFISRGQVENRIYQKHIEEASQFQQSKGMQQTADPLCSSIIHQPIYINDQFFGVLTADIKNGMLADEHKDVIYLISQLLNKHPIDREALQESASQKVDLLYESVKELNEEKFNLTQKAIHLADKLSMKLPVSSKSVLLNACKLVSYSVVFLENKLHGTKELDLLRNCSRLLKEKEAVKTSGLDEQVLAFLFQVLFQNMPVRSAAEWVEATIRNDVITVYESITGPVRTSEHEPVRTEIGSLSDAADVADVQSVIDQLTLTAREKEVLYLVLEGLNNLEVANYLNISNHTVKNHITNIFKKLNVTDRMQAMVKIYRIKYGEE